MHKTNSCIELFHPPDFLLRKIRRIPETEQIWNTKTLIPSAFRQHQGLFRGDNRARTCDNLRVMQVLSQLSYTSKKYCSTFFQKFKYFFSPLNHRFKCFEKRRRFRLLSCFFCPFSEHPCPGRPDGCRKIFSVCDDLFWQHIPKSGCLYSCFMLISI